MAESVQEIAPSGHVLSEQSAPVNPWKHSHTPHGREHKPLALQEFGHGVKSEAWAKLKVTVATMVVIDGARIWSMAEISCT